MLLTALFRLFPCGVCTIWFILFSLRSQPNRTQRTLAWLSAGGALYFFLDVSLFEETDNAFLPVVVNVLHDFFAIATPPFMLHATRIIRGVNRCGQRFWGWFVLPTALLLIESGLYLYFGATSQAIHSFRAFFPILLCCCNLLVLSLIVRELKAMHFSPRKFIAFFFSGGSSRTPIVIGVSFFIFLSIITVRNCLNDIYLVHQPTLTAVINLLLGLMLIIVASAAYISHLPNLSLRGIFNPELLIGEFELSQAEQLLDPTQAVETPIPVNAIPKEQQERLHARFKGAMEEGKMYLNPTITIDALSMHLCTNRLYLSRLVKTYYGCSFRDYINGKRIEFAKVYMMQYPEATQEVIANACGFLSAQAFSHKFKQLENCSPRQWLVRQLEAPSRSAR